MRKKIDFSNNNRLFINFVSNNISFHFFGFFEYFI